MPSSITLTVSHLPTSTSFFLSALQPLDYGFRGRCGNTIGFGSTTDQKAPPDFWLTQETLSVPAGAAHVAFNAPTATAVSQFFSAALKAGGKFYADPAVRDSSGYYSAAVIDFDGNSVEAVYRPTFSDDKENEVKSVVSTAKSKTPSATVSHAPPSAAPTTTSSRAPSPPKNTTTATVPGDIFDKLIADVRNAGAVARDVVQNAQNTQPTVTNTGNGETIMGTLLGVAAGAALHYAFTNNTEKRPSVPSRSVTEPVPPTHYQEYRAPDAVSYLSRPIALEDNDYASTVRPSKASHAARNTGNTTASGLDNPRVRSSASKVSRHSGMRLLEDESTTSRSSRHHGSVKMIEAPPPPPTASTHITSASSSRRSVSDPLLRPGLPSHRSDHVSDHGHSSRHSSRSDKTVIRTTESVLQRVSSRPSSHAASSRAGAPPLSRASTARKAPEEYFLPPSRAQTTLSRAPTARKAPEECPLPPSRAATWAVGSMASVTKSRSGDSKHSKTSKKESAFDKEVTPDDSISQISVGTEKTIKGSRR